MDKAHITYVAHLQNIIQDEPNTIRAFVAKDALAFGCEDLISYFINVIQGGGIVGEIRSLNCENDTNAFFDTYYEEIEKYKEEYEDRTNQLVELLGGIKESMAWFGFEEAATQIAEELKLYSKE